MPNNPSRPELLGALVLALSLSAVTFIFFRGVASSDLMAVYLAAEQFNAGHLDQIYTQGHATFDLAVPDSWRALAAAHGLASMRLYPFIYPPLWAAIAAPVVSLISPQSVFTIASLLNPVLLALSAGLAWRILRPQMALDRWMVAGLAIALFTPIGFVALFQNQPQILVSFLILLALERRRADAPVAAGLALALAASIKLYPVLFVLIWLARRDWPALRAFLLFGVGLGLASLLVGGIALNLEFLRQVRIISNTVLVTHLTFNLDSMLGQIFLGGQFSRTVPTAPGATLYAGLQAAKPLALGLLTKAIMIAGLAGFWALSRRATTARLYRNIWPALLIFVSLTSPLSWAYHYLSAVFLFPLLLAPRRHPWQTALTVAVLIPISLPVILYVPQIWGTLAMATLTVLFLIRAPAPD